MNERTLYMREYMRAFNHRPHIAPRLRARNTAAKARAKGMLTPQPCRDCGNLEVQMHHENYSKPLDVIWLCRSCHIKEHAKRKLPVGSITKRRDGKWQAQIKWRRIYYYLGGFASAIKASQVVEAKRKELSNL